MSKHHTILTAPLSMAGRQNNPLSHKIMGLASLSLDRLLLLHVVRGCYQHIPPCRDAFHFVEKALEILNIQYVPCSEDTGAVPGSGPLIVVANHPFGGIDGLVLTAILARVRKDIRILANLYLGAVPELRPIVLAVDPFGKSRSKKKNIASLAKAVRWVRSGGTLLTFPAGEVSHFSVTRRRIADPAWNETTGRLVHLTGASVLPVYFKGGNSPLFQVAGLVHPRLRTAMLPRELLKKRRTHVQLKIGNLIPYKRLTCFEDPGSLTTYLRFRTYLLEKTFEETDHGPGKVLRFSGEHRSRPRQREMIAPRRDASLLCREIGRLPVGQRLAQSDTLSVYYARARQIPETLHEIGRLREKAFQAAGEGTGKALDLDRFDQTYIHLFLWNKMKRDIAGACRLGRTDELLAREGKKGLYTHTLFSYRNAFLNDIGPSLEMGRTFVQPEYQKSYSALLLLWKGIGRYVVENPQYRMLFGAVSITNDYRSYSRQLMVTFLKIKHSLPHLSRMVRPRNPYRRPFMGLKGRTLGPWANDLEEVSSWISGIESDGKGLPILLKQYLKLGGKFISFNLDTAFGNALDGLIIVDLTVADPRIMKRYMGPEGLNTFLEYHSKADGQSVSRIYDLPLWDCPGGRDLLRIRTSL
ncbi:MAG: lysophospholipid acyltransferase family protein [Desulfatiglandales bacterium]